MLSTVVVSLALVFILLVLLAVTGLAFWNALRDLRTARDHIRHLCYVCHSCKGSGRVYLPGAVMRCSYCTAARDFLIEQEKDFVS
jgi:hypothetical protein